MKTDKKIEESNYTKELIEIIDRVFKDNRVKWEGNVDLSYRLFLELTPLMEDNYRKGLQQGRSVMHKTQTDLLSLMEKEDINRLTLREIGELVEVEHPQQVKHHLNQLIKWGYVDIISGKKVLKK